MNKDRYKSFNYKITTDPEFLDEQNAMEPALRDKIDELYFEVMEQKGGKKSVKKLQKLIEEFPNNPQLKNFLSVAYDNVGNRAKSREVNHWILAEHPDYLFGKLNRAAEYYEDEEYEKMPEVLGEEMEIQGLYPERNEFHLAEVTGFYKFAVLYYAAIGNLEAAGSRLEIMQEIAPDHPDTRFAELTMMEVGMEKSIALWEEEEKTKIHVTPASNTLPPQITEVPAIVNPLVIHLYENGLYIDNHLVNEILKLPRQSLIADLELILNDLMCRYEFFRQEVEDLDWDEKNMSFPIHAIMLLGELRAEESLPKVLEILSQDEDFLHFWFSDHITNSIWEPLYYLGNNQLDVLNKFIQEPGIDTYAKTAVSSAVSQIPYHQPERNDEVARWFSEVLDFFANSHPKDNVIDSDAIGLIICDVIDLRYKALLPMIKDLFVKQYVPEGITGDYKSVEKDIKEVQKYQYKKDLLNIVNRYENITTTWAGYKEDDKDIAFDDYVDYEDVPDIKPVRTDPKIGRNDPCPCGSGKKYKKCCLNK